MATKKSTSKAKASVSKAPESQKTVAKTSKPKLKRVPEREALHAASLLLSGTKKKKLPFAFVLDELERLSPTVKPMFGAHGVYVGPKIVFILYEKPGNTRDSGVWLKTDYEHHDSLRKEMPSIRSIEVFGEKDTKWQVIPAESDDFEEAVLHACKLVLGNDPRIGGIPASKSTKKSKKSATLADESSEE